MWLNNGVPSNSAHNFISVKWSIFTIGIQLNQDEFDEGEVDECKFISHCMKMMNLFMKARLPHGVGENLKKTITEGNRGIGIVKDSFSFWLMNKMYLDLVWRNKMCYYTY
ncbi:hypothetical protein Drorol1_Dr00023645 [Drosera rotundifolia]